MRARFFLAKLAAVTTPSRTAREPRPLSSMSDTVDFCDKWDMPGFDPAYDILPLEYFEPMVRRLFARERFMYDRK